jgi:hypothetical protein
VKSLYSKPSNEEQTSEMTSNYLNQNAESASNFSAEKIELKENLASSKRDLIYHYEEKIKLLNENIESLESKIHNINCEVDEKAAELVDVRERYNMTYLEAGDYRTRLNCIEEKTTGLRKVINENRKPIYNHVLVWLSTQLETSDKDTICAICSTHFTTEEIDEAKSILFDTCGGDNSLIGEKEIHNEGVKDKIRKDSKDIIEAMKKLKDADSEDNNLLFITSAEGVVKFPGITPCAEKEQTVSNKVHLTSKVIPERQSCEVGTPGAKNGVKESCEFLQIHGTNGIIMDPFLLWADIQRKMNPENIWKKCALKKFASTEITEAKETLWRVCGEQHLGKLVKRQGPNKSSSETNDICGAMKKLVEEDKLPLFICTSGMVARTPIYIDDSSGFNSTELNDHLTKIDDSIIKAVNTITETMETKLVRNHDSTIDQAPKQVNTAFGETITISDTAAGQDDHSEGEWNFVPRSGQKTKSEKPLPSHLTYLVVSNVDLDVRGLQLVQYLENKNISVTDWTLLTTRDDATYLTYRITVSKDDADKLKDSSIWPGKTEIRLFKPNKKRNRKDNSERKLGNKSKWRNAGVNSDQKNSSQNNEELRKTLSGPGSNRHINVYPALPAEYNATVMPGMNNFQAENIYAGTANTRLPWNGLHQSNTTFGSYDTPVMKNFMGENVQVGTFGVDRQHNTPFGSNAPPHVMNNDVGQSSTIRTSNSQPVSLSNQWYDTGFANNLTGINDGQTNSAGVSIPSILKRGPNWSDARNLPRVTFVDRLGADQFIQQ